MCDNQHTINVDHDEYDAAAAMMQRGELLRRLRRMEVEDESQRLREQGDEEGEQQQHHHSSRSGGNGETTLCYRTYLQDQRGVYDDYKHVNYKYIDFGVISPHRTGRPRESEPERLIIEQDRNVGKGGIVWDAAYILADSVIRCAQEEEWPLQTPEAPSSPSVVDLGSGTGVCGLIVARAFPHATVHLTDLPVLQDLLSRNVETTANATFGVLEWGKPVHQTYDVILGADVVAGIYDSSGLAKTIFDLSHENSRIVLSYRERLTGLMDRFEERLRDYFVHVERRAADSDNKNPNVFIMCVAGKRWIQ
jgi:hypothetical protein